MPGKKSCTKAKKNICSPSPCKYNVLTKKQMRRKKGSPRGSPKTVEVKKPNGKTLWMRWLWAYHCEAKKKDSDTKYSKSMKAAAMIYREEKMSESKNWTDAELREYAKNAQS